MSPCNKGPLNGAPDMMVAAADLKQPRLQQLPDLRLPSKVIEIKSPLLRIPQRRPLPEVNQ
jgi:hypothetical protein